MDGVLSDLDAATSKDVNGKRNKFHWKKPEATANAIQDAKNEKQVFQFYSNMPKTGECDRVWAAAAELAKSTGGKLVILTATPKSTDINQKGVFNGKNEWCRRNLNPQPDDVKVVEHGKKASTIGKLTATDVLVDDSENNIRDWINAGGTAIPHIPGSGGITVDNLKTPGKLGVEVDLSLDRAVRALSEIRTLLFDTGLDLEDPELCRTDSGTVAKLLSGIGGRTGRALEPTGAGLVDAIASCDGDAATAAYKRLASTLSGLQQNQEGYSTKFSQRAGKGKEFTLNGERHSLSIRQTTITFLNPARVHRSHNQAQAIKIPILAPYSSDDELFKYLIGVMKKEYGKQSDIDGFIDLVGSAIANYWLENINSPPDLVHVPASSVPLAMNLARSVATKLGCPDPVQWKKQPDKSKVIVNGSGVEAFVNPKSGRTSNKTVQEIHDRWMRQAHEWIDGTRQMKQMDEFARRGNLLNLYVPADNLSESDMADKTHLLIDDVTTFQTTISNMAWYLYDNQALSVTGAVAWRFG